MNAYRETFRRHRLRYLLPAVVLGLAVGAASYKSPMYVSSASLWVDNQVSAPSSLSVGPGNAQPETPAAAEATVLGELLTTTKFDGAVAAEAGLGSATRAGDAHAVDLIAGAVTSTTPGPQVLQVTATAASPTLAHDIVKATIFQLRSFSQHWATQFASSAVAYYQAQIASATRDLAAARAQGGANQRAAVSSATSALATATTALSQAQAQLNGQNSFTTVSLLDQPTFDPAPNSGLKSPVIKGLAGAIAGLVLSLLVIMIRTPGGGERWDQELSDPSPFVAGGGPFPAATGAERRWTTPTTGTATGPMLANEPGRTIAARGDRA